MHFSHKSAKLPPAVLFIVGGSGACGSRHWGANMLKLTKYLGTAIVVTAVIAAALIVSLFIELPVISPIARTVQGFLGF